jgi:hypothetical protein
LQEKPADRDFHVHTCIHVPVASCIFCETFHYNFLDFQDEKKKTLNFFLYIFDMPRSPQNLRERANGMLKDIPLRLKSLKT